MKRVEDQLGELICDMGKKEIQKALEEEVLAQLIEEGREEDFEKWKNGENIKRVFLTVSFDMGWNKQSSRTRYDSISGHAVLIENRFKKIIALCVLSKKCNTCDNAKSKGKYTPAHHFPKNYSGSSKSMEVQAFYKMVLEAFEKLRNWYYHFR